MKRLGKGANFLFFFFLSFFLFYVALCSCASALQKDARCENLSLSLPSGCFANGLFLLKLVFWASFEELLYRVLFPQELDLFLQASPIPSSFRSFCEHFLPHLLFASSHAHRGFVNVVFAFFASVFLRKMYVSAIHKAGYVGSFVSVCAIHSTYNICVLYLGFAQEK